MKLFGYIGIILNLSVYGLADNVSIPNNTFSARHLLGYDWCSLKCGSQKHIACEVGGHCHAKEPCQFGSVDKAKMVDVHNKLRNKFASGEDDLSDGLKVANMLAVQWDNDLAFVASCNLAKCGGMHHDKCRKTPGFSSAGQNLWMFGSTGKATCIEKAIKGISAWYNEIKLLSTEEVKALGDKVSFDKKIGHFTQLIWAKVTHIGCAVTQQEKGGKTQCHSACNYGPAGNVVGVGVFKEGEPCSQCPKGIQCGKTYKGLCGEGGVGESVSDSGSRSDDLRPNIGLICVFVLLMYSRILNTANK